ncbi:MAG TPA: carboxypeptidase-like regulatory domain-containing protein, partial [Dongiaceae bacterium]|nr:carboxypeptidase-like regulatory domain-containing protein [Dongiaceae bacterium]
MSLAMGSTAIALLWLLLSATPRPADPGNICGVVQDQTGAAIGEAALELTSEGIRFTVHSDASGQFCFNRIEPGDYQLTTRARDFR